MTTRYTTSEGKLYKSTEDGGAVLVATGLSEQDAAEIVAAMNAYKPPKKPPIGPRAVVSITIIGGTPLILGQTVEGRFELLSSSRLPFGVEFASEDFGIRCARRFWGSLTPEDRQEIEASISEARAVNKTPTIVEAVMQLRKSARTGTDSPTGV